MSNEPDREESASPTQSDTASEPDAPQPNAHQAVIDAARAAEKAVADSAFTPGLGQRN